MPRFIRDLVRNSLDHIGITSYHRYAIRQWISSFRSQHRRRYRESLEFHSQFIQRGDLVFDVGANIGNRTEIYLSLGARVVAIEPQSRCVEFLESRFAGKKDIIIVPTAVGAAEAKETLFVSDSSTISSMSPEWIQAVKESGRFTQHRWDEATTIDVTTLDSLIDKYGKPSFIKIDTEGYELPVLKGLSHPITTISFEFTPELIQVAYACIRHLDRQFEYLFNYSVGESMKCELAEYTTAEEVTRLLADIPSEVFGDVYARNSKITAWRKTILWRRLINPQLLSPTKREWLRRMGATVRNTEHHGKQQRDAGIELKKKPQDLTMTDI